MLIYNEFYELYAVMMLVGGIFILYKLLPGPGNTKHSVMACLFACKVPCKSKAHVIFTLIGIIWSPLTVIAIASLYLLYFCLEDRD